MTYHLTAVCLRFRKRRCKGFAFYPHFLCHHLLLVRDSHRNFSKVGGSLGPSGGRPGSNGCLAPKGPAFLLVQRTETVETQLPCVYYLCFCLRWCCVRMWDFIHTIILYLLPFQTHRVERAGGVKAILEPLLQLPAGRSGPVLLCWSGA